MIDNHDVFEEDLIKRVEQELNNIISIRESLEKVLKNFDVQTKVLLDVEKRVRELETKIEMLEIEQNRTSVMYG